MYVGKAKLMYMPITDNAYFIFVVIYLIFHYHKLYNKKNA